MKEERIVSALIGLVGACANNPKTPNTDTLVIKALAFPRLCPDGDFEQLVEEIYAEKNAVSPGCAHCAMPCGNTSDYDMDLLYSARPEIRDAKLRVLQELQTLAACVWRCEEREKRIQQDGVFFYKALAYVSYDMKEADLLALLDEAREVKSRL